MTQDQDQEQETDMEKQPQNQLTVLGFRINGMEKDLGAIKSDLGVLKQQFSSYVTTQVNELQLKEIRDTLSRIERRVDIVETGVGDIKKKQIEIDSSAKERDNKQQISQYKLQIQVLAWVVGIIVSTVLLILGAYFTHVFH